MIIFLDTHIWNYLVDDARYSEAQLEQARERLVSGVKQGEWEVICSLPVLQEILSIYRGDPKKYGAVRTLLFEAVQNCWLKELKDRYVAELYSGGVLASTSCYIPRDLRRKIKTLADKKKDVIDISDATYREGLDFKENMQDAKTKIFTDLGSSDGKPPKKIAPAYDKWFKNDRDLEGWVFKVLEGGAARKLFPISKIEGFKPTYANVPSAWQYVDFRQAKILLNLGHQIAIQASDAVDADTYACSPYYELLVTDDRRFKETIDIVIGDEFKVCGFRDLMEMLEVVRPSAET